MASTTAAESDSVEQPTAAAPSAAANAVTDAAPEDVPSPEEDEATGLIDLTFGNKTSPIKHPVLTLPLGLGSIDFSPRDTPTAANPVYGGGAFGGYAKVKVGNLIQIKTSKLGEAYLDPTGTVGGESRKIAKLAIPPSPFASTLYLEAVNLTTLSGTICGPCGPPIALSRVQINRALLISLEAEGIYVNAVVKKTADGSYTTEATTRFTKLVVGGTTLTEPAIKPNTTYTVPGLGKVVLNEQTITRIPGDRYAAKVHGIHITLSTATLGLPVGADVYIGTAEAIVYD